MDKSIEALKLALEALKANYLLVNGTETHGGLEQCLDGYYSSCFDTDPINKQTEEAITAIEEVLAEHAMREVQRLGREIEPKIGCVNHDCDQCKAQPEQEPVQKPVAVVSSCTGVGDKGVRVKWLGGFPQIGDRLYFHPPQRTWVGLTKNERLELYTQFANLLESDDCEYEKAIEAILKEKNT